MKKNLKHIVRESIDKVLNEKTYWEYDDNNIYEYPEEYNGWDKSKRKYKAYNMFDSDHTKEALSQTDFADDHEYYGPGYKFTRGLNYINVEHGRSEDIHNKFDKDQARMRNNQKAADKRWQKSADSRPLHSKNSANRDIMDMDRKKNGTEQISESQINRVVSRVVESILG